MPLLFSGTLLPSSLGLWRQPPWAPMTCTVPGTLRSQHLHFNTLIEVSAIACLPKHTVDSRQAEAPSAPLSNLFCARQSEHSDIYQRNDSKACGQRNEHKLFKTQYSGPTITVRNRLIAVEGPSPWNPLVVRLRRSGPEGSSPKRCTCW